MDVHFKLDALIASSANDTRTEIVNSLSGCNIYNSSSFFETIEKFSSHEPDIVFIDDDLVSFDTDSTIREILKLDKTAICVILSSNARKERIITAQATGAFAYILKPFTPSKIHECMQKIMDLQVELLQVPYSDLELKKAKNFSKKIRKHENTSGQDSVIHKESGQGY